VQGCVTGKSKWSVQKEANIMHQKWMAQEGAAQNIKNQFKSSWLHPPDDMPR
jgi:hypothetical protein